MLGFAAPVIDPSQGSHSPKQRLQSRRRLDTSSLLATAKRVRQSTSERSDAVSSNSRSGKEVGRTASLGYFRTTSADICHTPPAISYVAWHWERFRAALRVTSQSCGMPTRAP